MELLRPFELLTPQVWEKVLGQLKDPQDKLNLINTHPELENAFEDNKAGWGFCVALPLIFARTEKVIKNENDEELKRTYRNCRLVSISCYNAVDDYVKGYWDRDENLSSPPSIFPAVRLGSTKRFLAFCAIFRDAPKKGGRGSPLVMGRELTLTCSGVYDTEIPMKGCSSSLLKILGPQLRSMRLKLVRFENFFSICGFLQEVLALCPNLSGFEFEYNPVIVEAGERPNAFDLPRLPNLKHLIVKAGPSATSMPDFISFLPYFPQLTYLKLPALHWKASYDQTGLFPKLQHLVLQKIDILNAITHKKVIHMLMKLVAPQLKWLQLDIHAESAHYEDANKKLAFMEQVGMHFLQRRCSQWNGNGMMDWESRVGNWNKNGTEQEVTLDIYNKSKFLPNLVNLPTTPTPFKPEEKSQDEEEENAAKNKESNTTGYGAVLSTLLSSWMK